MSVYLRSPRQPSTAAANQVIDRLVDGQLPSAMASEGPSPAKGTIVKREAEPRRTADPRCLTVRRSEVEQLAELCHRVLRLGDSVADRARVLKDLLQGDKKSVKASQRRTGLFGSALPAEDRKQTRPAPGHVNEG